MLELAALSHAGPVRAVNEDSFLQAPDIGLWVVADGMGGHEGGQIASRMIIDCLDIDLDRSNENVFIQDVIDRLGEANREIREVSQTRFQGRTIGSTAVVLLVYGRKAICLWAGDSRLYLLREGNLRQVNYDHSQVADLVRRGVFSTEQAANHPLRNVITRAVGVHNTLVIDRCDVNLCPGDTLLLCSDGLNKVLSDDDIRMILSRSTCDLVVHDLIRCALARAATDNITVCVVATTNGVATSNSAPFSHEPCSDDDPTMPSN